MSSKLTILFGLLLAMASSTALAQKLSEIDKPMWTMEFIHVKPGMYGLTLGYLDDNWMRVREEARRQGAVITYRRLVEQSAPESDRNIVLITEFKNTSAYWLRDTLFESIRKQLPNATPGILRPEPGDLFEPVKSIVFLDCQDSSNVQPRMLSQDYR
jgi:hypothetical protein